MSTMSDLIAEHQLTVELPLRYDVFIPSDEHSAPRPLLLALHGYGGSKRQMMREAKQLAPDDFVVVAPQGFISTSENRASRARRSAMASAG
jgi:predicted esterase